jgi:hypothetical protein
MKTGIGNLAAMRPDPNTPGACPDCAGHVLTQGHRADCPQLAELCMFCGSARMAPSPCDCVHVTVHTIVMEATVHPEPIRKITLRTCTVCKRRMWNLGDGATTHPACSPTPTRRRRKTTR